MSRGPDAATLLERALADHAARARIDLTLTRSKVKRWASVTFAGMQHQLTLTSPATNAFDAWLEALPDAEFDLRGHLVADLMVESVRREAGVATVELEVLTVEER